MRGQIFSVLLALGSLAATGCVVSTHEDVGVAPVLPLPPEAKAAQERAARQPTGPREIGARHVLISYRGAMRAAPYVQRTKQEAAEAAEKIRQEALGGADFSELARQYSDDRGSAANGGSLGVFSRDQMVPQFSEAAFALPVGGVSEVVESPFGFHVIMRDE